MTPMMTADAPPRSRPKVVLACLALQRDARFIYRIGGPEPFRVDAAFGLVRTVHQAASVRLLLKWVRRQEWVDMLKARKQESTKARRPRN